MEDLPETKKSRKLISTQEITSVTSKNKTHDAC